MGENNRLSIPRMARIVKKVIEIMDQNKNAGGMILVNPKYAQELEKGYVSLPYVFRKDVFQKVFVEELNLTECKDVQGTLETGNATTPRA